ncbi:MAG TPA: TAXI family TRAP transporter solute-binding subunit [Burkholderiales bacterium]|nr:TAXI family TRAP transporter solute-binding subunit [Burkholderiales bacterium]
MASLFRITRISWRDLSMTVVPFVVLLAVALWIASRFVHPAPPDTITITSGPEGSSYALAAERYRKILARQGVTLKTMPSQGSLDNLKRLADPKVQVDIGFVQGGLAAQADTGDLVSLGSIFYTPVYVFYRAPKPIERLSELSGKRVSIGREGSGTNVLAAALLRANGIDGKDATKLVNLEGKVAEDALQAKQVDAAFLMGDSAAFANVRDLLRTEGVRLFDFKQADAYVRRFRYLTKLEIPAGALDLGRNLPPENRAMVAPTVELIARSDLHPALSDMLIEAAREVHGRANLFQKAGEFPAPLEHEYRVSDDAKRYYQSGKTFAYRHLPFWLASLVDRIVVVLVPLAVLLIPGFKLLPWLYRWRVNQRIYRRYAELMALERAAFAQTTPQERTDLLRRLDKIEENVIKLKVPGSFAEQGYILRQHIGFVRARLAQAGG